MPVRALGWYGATSSDLVQSLRYAAGLSNASGTLPANRADVINMSLGGDVFDQTEADACWAAHQAGCVVVAAAGNENTTATSYPAGYAGVISVMAVGYDLTRAPYSNYGASVDVAAPGGNSQVDKNGDGHGDGILSTLYQPGTGYYYEWYDGTSMASPHVAGVAALVRSIDPTLTPDQVETILESTAQDLGAPGKDSTFGWGLVDAYAAVKAAFPPVPKAPQLSVAPLSLNFGVLDVQQDVGVSNLGDGLVTVGPVTVTTESGGAWLTAVPLAGDATATTRAIRVGVDRTGLPEGTYFGKVAVASDAGSASVDVVMSVLFAAPPLPDVNLRVQAIRVDTGLVAQTVTVNPLSTLTWSFPTLPAGRYKFVCGSDFDGDGVIGEPGDYYGIYGLEGSPTVVDLPGGTTVSNLDFRVSVRESFAPGASR
jgi:serine protease